VRADSLVIELLDAGGSGCRRGLSRPGLGDARRRPDRDGLRPSHYRRGRPGPLGGRLLDAGTADTLAVEVDIQPSAPVGSIELIVREAGVCVAEPTPADRSA